MGDFLDFLAGVSIAVGHGVGLQAHDLLALVDIVLELTCLCFQLLRLIPLFSNFTLQLLLGLINSSNALLGVLLKLLDLVLKPLLVLLVLLHMLALDYLLSLLGNPIELYILGTLLEVLDFKVEALFLVLDFFQVHLEIAYFVHKLDFQFAFAVDFLVFVVDKVAGNEDGVFVVGGNWKLWDFNLTLLEIDNHFEVVADLVDSVESLVLGNGLAFVLLVKIVELVFEVLNMLVELLDLVLELFLVFHHFDSAVALLNETFEVLLAETCDIVLLKVENLTFFIILENLLDASFINSTKWIKVNDASRKFLFARIDFSRHNLSLALTIFDEGLDLPVGLWEHSSQFLFLLTNAAVVGISGLKILCKALESLNQLLLGNLFFKKSLHLLAIFDFVESGFLAVMDHNDQPDDVELLLEDSDIDKEFLFEQLQEAFLKSQLYLNNLSLDLLEILLPRLLLLVLEFLLLLFEFLQSGLFFIGHVFFLFVHPVFFNQIFIQNILVFFEVEFGTAHHGLQTSLSNVITL